MRRALSKRRHWTQTEAVYEEIERHTNRHNQFTQRVSKDIAEKMKNDQKFLSSVMEKVSAVETKQALKRKSAGVDTNIAGAGGSGTRRLRARAVLVRNSAGAGLRKQSRAGLYPVPLTPTVKDPPSATLQPGAACGNPLEAMQRSSPSIQSDRHESQEITHKMTLFLLDLTRSHQQLYFRNKMAFYKTLQTAFAQKRYNLSSEKIRKKLANLLTTYKRVKDRRRATGEGKHSWEYYTLMDELFGSSGIGTAPYTPLLWVWKRHPPKLSPPLLLFLKSSQQVPSWMNGLEPLPCKMQTSPAGRDYHNHRNFWMLMKRMQREGLLCWSCW